MLNPSKGIFSNFITHTIGYDAAGDFDLKFYHAVLKIDMEPFKKGNTVDVIYFDFIEDKKTTITIFHKDIEYVYNVDFTVKVKKV